MRATLLLSAAVLLYSGAALAVDADPSTYQNVLPTLKPGDTLNLAPGTYTSGLNVTGLNGTEGAWITITGPASGAPAIFEGDACCNTVELVDSSYVVLKSITIDGKGIPGVFGVSAKKGLGNVVHHITIEGCTFVGQNGSQQTVSISTKTPTWGWTIRGNIIDGAGTGIYLGNSTYDDPFIGGVIENNLIKNTIGYGIQIKNQNAWPDHAAVPKTDMRTVIRDNVFIKNDAPSPDGNRPNLFVGAFPTNGIGSGGLVEVYGNLFVHNVPEALLQATGRVSIHDNIFVDAGDMAINLRDHDGFPLRLAHVYNNTVYAAKQGVVFGNAASEGDAVLGNLIFAETPVSGPIKALGENIGEPVASAPMFVASPSTKLGEMDFYPLAGKAEGPALDLSPFTSEEAFECDFNGASKGGKKLRGAYAGSGANPGWKLAEGIKPAGLSCEGAGGSGQGGAGGAGGAGGEGGGATSGAGEPDEGGCGCKAAGSGVRVSGLRWAAIVAAAALFFARRGRRR